MDSLIAAFVILLIFQIAGGVLLGLALRRWRRREFSCNSFFLVVWGLILGVVPFVPGVMVFAPHGDLLLVGLAAGVLVALVVLVGLVPDTLVGPRRAHPPQKR